MKTFFYHFSSTVFGFACAAAIIWRQQAIPWIVVALACLWVRQTLQINVFLQYAIDERRKQAGNNQ